MYEHMRMIYALKNYRSMYARKTANVDDFLRSKSQNKS